MVVAGGERPAWSDLDARVTRAGVPKDQAAVHDGDPCVRLRPGPEPQPLVGARRGGDDRGEHEGELTHWGFYQHLRHLGGQICTWSEPAGRARISQWSADPGTPLVGTPAPCART